MNVRVENVSMKFVRGNHRGCVEEPLRSHINQQSKPESKDRRHGVSGVWVTFDILRIKIEASQLHSRDGGANKTDATHLTRQ